MGRVGGVNVRPSIDQCVRQDGHSTMSWAQWQGIVIAVGWSVKQCPDSVFGSGGHSDAHMPVVSTSVSGRMVTVDGHSGTVTVVTVDTVVNLTLSLTRLNGSAK